VGGGSHAPRLGGGAVEAARRLKGAAQHTRWNVEVRARPLPSDAEIRLRAASELTERSRRELVQWLADAFQWRERYADFHWHIEVVSGRERLAHLGLVRRTVRVRERHIDTALVGGVLTEPRWRHRGLATVLMRSADAFVTQRLQLRFGLLLCAESLVTLYEGLGWELLRSPLVYDQPTGPRLRSGPAMVKRYGNTSWPTGPVDLTGLPV
jgi:hypothetical protein